MKLRFYASGRIKPYVRMTRRGKFVKDDAREYLASKMALALQFRAQMADRDLLAGPLSVTILLRITEGMHRKDLDNQIKAVLDAANGIIWRDDRWIDAIFAKRILATTDKVELLVTSEEEVPSLDRIAKEDKSHDPHPYYQV